MSILSRAEAYWLASEYSGTGNWLDLSGNGHTAALPGGTNDPTFYGLNDGRGYLRMPAIVNNHVSTPDATKFDIIDDGDLDLRVFLTADDYTATGGLISKADGTVTSGWYFRNEADSKLKLFIGDGIANEITSSTGSGLTDGTRQGLRVTWDKSADDVMFYIADDPTDVGTAWTQLGTTVATGTTSGTNNAVGVSVGSLNVGGFQALGGEVHQVQIYDGIDGTLIADIDFTRWADPSTTQTDPQGNVWTVNTSGSAEVARIVQRKAWWYDTDDWHTVADHANLNFDVTDSFTVAIAFRPFDATPSANMGLLAKRAALVGADAGYDLYHQPAGNVLFDVGDGAVAPFDASANLSALTDTVIVGVRNVVDDDIEIFTDGAGSGTPATDTNTATSANALALLFGVGTTVPANVYQGEILGAAVFREALTDAEVASLQSELLPGLSSNMMTLGM